MFPRQARSAARLRLAASVLLIDEVISTQDSRLLRVLIIALDLIALKIIMSLAHLSSSVCNLSAFPHAPRIPIAGYRIFKFVMIMMVLHKGNILNLFLNRNLHICFRAHLRENEPSGFRFPESQA